MFALCHFFNVRDGGAGSIDRLCDPLQQADLTAKQADYGWVRLLNGMNYLVSKGLITEIRKGEILTVEEVTA